MRSGFRFSWGFVPRLASLYVGLFILSGIQMPFLPVWLKGKGVDPAMIGVVVAVPMIVRAFATPFVARVVDRRDAVRGAIMVASCVSVLGLVLVGLADTVLAILITYMFASLASTPVLPLTEAYALKGLGVLGRAYGPVRLWGSAAFIVGNFAAGFAADIIPASDLIWLIVGTSVPIALASLTLPPLSTAAVVQAGESSVARGSLLSDPVFIALLAAASLIQASHAVFYGFSALQWRADGFDGTAIAALWALGVIAEIVLFAAQGRLPPFITPTVLLMAGALGAVLRWLVMAVDPPTFLLPWVQLLHALSFGATHLGTLMLLVRITPANQGATAQAYLAIALSLTMAGAMALSGLLYENFGSRAYAAMALTAFAGGACGFVAHRIRREPAR
ncbi:MAG TPA: MFS transporter [Pseudolabrys sp.]|nr:MFS transporter [Pseudolabrys sp.]